MAVIILRKISMRASRACFNVARTISNQTGQVIQMIGLIMVCYLAISLATSLLMNLYNRRVRLVER